jgi:hypothetical protein
MLSFWKKSVNIGCFGLSCFVMLISFVKLLFCGWKQVVRQVPAEEALDFYITLNWTKKHKTISKIQISSYFRTIEKRQERQGQLSLYHYENMSKQKLISSIHFAKVNIIIFITYTSIKLWEKQRPSYKSLVFTVSTGR